MPFDGQSGGKPKRKLVCLDTEYDARYTDRGVSRLACMTYSYERGAPQLVGPEDAVKLWVTWARDPSIVFLVHSGYHDFAVLADEAHLHFEGALPEAPGVGPYWELAHALYDAKRVQDTEIRQRLTHVRFGPHKASVQLAAIAKQEFGIDMGADKTVPAEARELLDAAMPYAEWPEDVYLQTPWRVKFGHLLELHGNDVSAYPKAAAAYALEDAALPWRVFKRQRETWRRAIPDQHPQTWSSWMLHMVSIPGWVADRERAQSIRVAYRKTIVHCERTLLDSGVLEIDGPRPVQKQDKLKARVFAALGDDTPISKSAAGRLDAPTSEERREFAATDAKTCAHAIAKLGGPAVGTTPKQTAVAYAAALASVSATVDAVRSQAAWAALYAHTLHSKTEKSLTATGRYSDLADGARSAAASEIAIASKSVLVDAGLLEIVTNRTIKAARVQQRVYALLGDEAPLTDTGYELYGNNPTPAQRLQYCSKDAKAIRAAILHKGATPRNIADAVEKAEQGGEVFDAWLEGSGETVLNALAVRSKAYKTIVNFLDKLDASQRIRTAYVTTVDTGRAASRGGGAGMLNVQQLPRDYDKPKYLHVRGCIVPDPGWCFLVADYSQLELCSLAHILTKIVRHYARDPKRKRTAERMLGFEISESYESELSKAINAGQDCHVRMASVLRGYGESYAECQAIYKHADEKKSKTYYGVLGVAPDATTQAVLDAYTSRYRAGKADALVERALVVLSDEVARTFYDSPLSAAERKIIDDRQLSKPCNFGFPGGLGAPAFVGYAAGYGVVINPAIAQQAKDAYMAAWPEMKLYFAYIKLKIKKAQAVGDYAGLCVQITSKRERGDCILTQWANGWFQGLAADGAKHAGKLLVNAAYRHRTSPMYGTRPSGFVHDEYLVNCRREQAEQALPEVERLMVQGMRDWIPDVAIKAPGKVLYERWGK